MTRAEESEDLLRWLDSGTAVRVFRDDEIVFFRDAAGVIRWPLRCTSLRDALANGRNIDEAVARWNQSPL